MEQANIDKLFSGAWKFFHNSSAVDQLPSPDQPEIVFFGRSNVGKSSLINSLTRQRSLARSSRTPGCTRGLIFFEHPKVPWRLVDVPGYGYAKASKVDRASWGDLIISYLRERANIYRVFVLIDARRGVSEIDQEIFEMLDKLAISYQIVITKADKASGALVSSYKTLPAQLKNRVALIPPVLITSASKKPGPLALQQELASLMLVE